MVQVVRVEGGDFEGGGRRPDGERWRVVEGGGSMTMSM